MSILEVNNVSKSFGGVKANVDISMSVEKGKIVGLIGPNGSGKTTLMKMLVGLYKPEKGKITIDGININTFNLEYLRDNVNYVNQTTKLFEDSVLYNMKYGNDVKESDIIAKLKKYQLDSSNTIVYGDYEIS